MNTCLQVDTFQSNITNVLDVVTEVVPAGQGVDMQDLEDAKTTLASARKSIDEFEGRLDELLQLLQNIIQVFGVFVIVTGCIGLLALAIRVRSYAPRTVHHPTI
jgi:hypothetical protein